MITRTRASVPRVPAAEHRRNLKPRITFILGCTGSGKGGLGRELARRTGGEIVSVDSMKVFRRMNIGTAKPSLQVRKEIPHHLIDVVEPWEDFSVAQYVSRAEAAIADIHARGRPIFAVGGTPLYIKSLSEGLFEGPSADMEIRARLHAEAAATDSPVLHEKLQRVDPQAASRIHPNDLRRIVRALEVFELTGTPISMLQTQWDADRLSYECVFIGLRRELEDQNHRTNQRVKRMIEAGLVEEVKSLLAEEHPLSTTARQALGYAEIIEHLTAGLPLAQAVEKIKINTRQFAKAQRTWFKRFRRTEWIDLKPDETAEQIADELIKQRGSLWLP
jgi:tRNA dimethylallyltransferase